MESIKSLSLCESEQPLSMSGREDCQQLVEAMSRQAQHSIYIFTEELEPELYDTTWFIDAVRRIVSGDPNARIRILLYSIDRLVQRSRRLIELSRRLSSHIQIRQLSRPYHHAFFVADRCGVVNRRVAGRFEGTASFNDPGHASELIAFFNSTWDISSRNPELHALQI